MRTSLFVLSMLGFLAACGDGRGELREWKASDHQPPPAQVPEGQGTGQEEGGDPAVRAGQALWSMRCASCHGPSGRGDGPGRPPGAAIPDMSTAAYQQSRTNDQLAEVIQKGRNLMPAFEKELSPAGVGAMVRHIRTFTP